MQLPPYEVRTSTRRRRSMTAFRDAGQIIVVVPAHLSARQRRDLVPALVQRFLDKEARKGAPRGDDELTQRTRLLYEQYVLPATGGEVPALAARWVGNQRRRWGSCTPDTGEIRITDRLRRAPAHVVDYVLLHEAIHLVERNHTRRFHEILARFEDAERAEAFLQGIDFATAQGLAPDDGDLD
ncbi:M48 metallopeptidase family protein [Nigerium massiliense]|uniref:M48 metallopeptidase family protein n=1 Tax=Nigerium massiliense TaxID=1522317 RepID=UPI00058C1FF4|nr:M48 family metallopeptidase [Nigerium massiliense]